MGFFSDLTAMRDEAKQGQKAVAEDHRGCGYDVLPGRLRGRVCIWLLLWHMLMAGVYGFVAFWLLRPAWHGGTASGWIVFGALAVVPIWLCLGALRRCGETVLSRYDLYGGVVTDRNREKHVHRDTDDGHEHTTYTYFVDLNGVRHKVAVWRYHTMPEGSYHLAARYRRRYLSQDKCYFFPAPLMTENDRTAQHWPSDELRLESPARMSLGTLMGTFFPGVLSLVLFCVHTGVLEEDGVPPVWMLPAAIGLAVFALVCFGIGLRRRFQEEAAQLEHLRIEREAYLK